ncbi:hypothetical protein ABT025_16115 [Streptomyces sp. NPDC002809]|uniref:hypothetical protein n=1 Tax=Streptomyces sp. NPDC002809 TaxID=3154433 RepID=UPI0033297FAE
MTLAPLFPDPTRAVDDVLVDNGWRAHALEHHLTAAETGAAITEGLVGGVRWGMPPYPGGRSSRKTGSTNTSINCRTST